MKTKKNHLKNLFFSNDLGRDNVYSGSYQALKYIKKKHKLNVHLNNLKHKNVYLYQEFNG